MTDQKALALNVKNMKETYLNSRCDEDVWNTFYAMVNLGYITRSQYDKFSDICVGWVYDDFNDCVVDYDEETGNEIIVKQF